jgi:hypothetical protein
VAHINHFGKIGQFLSVGCLGLPFNSKTTCIKQDLQKQIFHTFPMKYFTDIKFIVDYTQTSFCVLMLAFIPKEPIINIVQTEFSILPVTI